MLERRFGSSRGGRGRRAARFSLDEMCRILLALALLVGCRTAPPDPAVAGSEDAVTFRVVQSGAYGAAANAEAGTSRESRLFVASTPDAYEALWRAHVGDATAPPLDFARETAVFLLLGQRSTGGWGVTPESVAIAGDAIEVTASIRRPEPGGIATMAFSAPFAVIAVNRPALHAAVWKDAAGNVVTAAEPR